MSLPETVRQAWENREGPIIFTTVDKTGQPNAIYATCVKMTASDTVVVADNFFNKTRANILSSPQGSVLFITTEGKSFQLKGNIVYHKKGSVYDEMKQWNPEKLPGNAAAELIVESVYSGAEQLA